MERRELARQLFAVADGDAVILSECDRRADERFLMLDAWRTKMTQPIPGEV